jgi:hypothetical protein
MTLGVHQVDGRIALQAAVKIRAALRTSVDAKKVIEDYAHTHPQVTDNITLDRVRARAWAMHNVALNHKPLEEVIRKHYAEMYVTGLVSTYEQVGILLRSKKARKSLKDIVTNALKNLGSKALELKAGKALQESVDWKNWKAGNAAAEVLLRPTGGLEKLLNGIKIKSLDMKNSSYDRLGTQLADGLHIGASPSKMAKMITDSLSMPERSLTIALTEGSRAANVATNDAYQNLGVQRIVWIASDPEDEECDIDGEETDVDGEFSNGLTADDIPVHPNCRCSTMPAEIDYSSYDYQAALDEALNASD